MTKQFIESSLDEVNVEKVIKLTKSDKVNELVPAMLMAILSNQGMIYNKLTKIERELKSSKN